MAEAKKISALDTLVTSEFEYLDVKGLVAEYEDDDDFAILIDVANSYLKNPYEILDVMEVAIKERRHDDIKAHAHKFRGVIANFNAVQAIEKTRLIEQAAVDADDSTIDLNYHALKDMMPNVINELKRLNNDTGTSEQAVPAEAAKILIVDDDRTSIELFSKRLERLGYDVNASTDPHRTGELIKSFAPDIVLLDIEMPKISGMEVLASIRKDHASVALPVIMVTANDQNEQLVAALKAGANDYVTKPINIDVACARISSQLELARLHKDSVEKKEIEAINSLVITYNHEINNPLMVAMMLSRKIAKTFSGEEVDRLNNALDRIAKIVKKISSIGDQPVKKTTYASSGAKMIDVE